MPRKRSSKTLDMEKMAADILEEAVGVPAPITPLGRKNPAAVDSGREGNVGEGAAGAKLIRATGRPLKKRKA